MWRNIIGQSIYQLVFVFLILFGGQKIGGYEYDFNDDLVINGKLSEKAHHYTVLF
jgi:hypothetical protein